MFLFLLGSKYVEKKQYCLELSLPVVVDRGVVALH